MGIIFFVSCTTENVQLDQTAKQNSISKQSNIVELSKLWTINNSDSLAILKGVQKIDWDNAVVSNTDKGETLEVPLILKNNLKVSYLETKNEVANKLLFIKDASGKLNTYQMMIATKDKISPTDPSLSFSNLNSSFDGYVAFVKPNGKLVDLLPSVHRSKPSLTGREPDSCTYYVEMYDDGTYRYISLLFCTFNGGTMASPIGGGGGGGSGAPSISDKIDDSKLDSCLQSILSKLKTLTRGVNQIVVTFAGDTPNYNWNLKSDYLNGLTGATNPPALYDFSTGSITTTLDSKTWTEATDLSWARTMLHESIHAYLATQFAINRKDFTSSYPTMVSEWGVMQNWNNIHHEEIARSIVNDVALALEEYGKSNGYNLPSQFYQDMAWGGLQDTTTFKNLPFADQQRILDVIATELTGADTNGNTKTQNGKKAGC